MALNLGEDGDMAKFPKVEVGRMLRIIDEGPQDGKTPLKKRETLEVINPSSVDFLGTGLLEDMFENLEGTDEVGLGMLPVQ